MTADALAPAVERYLDDHREALVERVLDLLAIPTANPPGETEAAVAYLEESLASAGIETERLTVDPAKPNLLAHLPGSGPGTLGFNGHLDTVPVEPAAWSRDPHGERSGARLYGRGAADMKGPLAAMVAVARAFAETGTDPPVSLAWSFVADEEVGGEAGLAAVLQADRFAVDACVIGEPTCRGDRHSMAIADRGSIWLTLEAAGEAAHGSRPMLGENAIDRLTAAVDRLRDRVGRHEFEVDAAIVPILEESVAFYGPVLGHDAARQLFERPTVNLGRLEGGEAINQVPRHAVAEIDIRLPAGIDTRTVLADLRDCIDGCDGISVVDLSWSTGTAEAFDAPLVAALHDVAEDVAGERVYRRSATGGGDAKRLRRRGVSAVEFALGPDTAHAVDEYTTVEAIARTAAVYARVPFAYAEARRGGSTGSTRTDPSGEAEGT